MKEVRIYDKNKETGCIISLGELINCIDQLDPRLLDGKWKVTSAYGYGELICSIEDVLDTSEEYLIDARDIFPKLKSEEEFFYDAEMKKVDSDLEIGLFDSAYVFVRSSDEKLTRHLESSFEKLRIIEC